MVELYLEQPTGAGKKGVAECCGFCCYNYTSSWISWYIPMTMKFIISSHFVGGLVPWSQSITFTVVDHRFVGKFTVRYIDVPIRSDICILCTYNYVHI